MKRTHTIIALDKSGSMRSRAAQAVISYNEQVQAAKMSHKPGEHEITVSLITFDHEIYEHLWGRPASELKETTAENYRAVGGTAFRDAIGYIITKTLSEVTLGKEDGIHVVMISDGQDENSHRYSRSSLKELVDSCNATGQWTFSYIGCDEKQLKEVEEIGVLRTNMAKFSNVTAGTAQAGIRAATRLASNTYYKARLLGANNCMNVMSSSIGEEADMSALRAEEPETQIRIASDSLEDVFGNATKANWKFTEPKT